MIGFSDAPILQLAFINTAPSDQAVLSCALCGGVLSLFFTLDNPDALGTECTSHRTMLALTLTKSSEELQPKTWIPLSPFITYAPDRVSQQFNLCLRNHAYPFPGSFCGDDGTFPMVDDVWSFLHVLHEQQP